MEGLSQEYRKTKELEIKYQNTNGRRILNLIPRGVQICIPLKLRTPDGKSNSNSVLVGSLSSFGVSKILTS